MALTTLQSLLALKPLDRVLVRQPGNEIRRYGRQDHWFYVQGIDGEHVRVMTPLGHARKVSLDTIECIEVREPITVRACTERAFLDRVAGRTPSTDLPETVFVVLGACDQGRHDLRLNLTSPSTGEAWAMAGHTVVHPDDWAAVMPLVRRDLMPVARRLDRKDSAAAGDWAVAVRTAQRQTQRFIRDALRGISVKADHDLRSPMPPRIAQRGT